MTKRFVLIAALILAAATVGWLIYRSARPSSLGATAFVRRGTIEASLDALGTVQVERQVNVSSRVGGTVRSIAVQPGDAVLSGTLLLELENAEVQDALTQAERALEVRTLELEEALAAPDQATIDLAVARLRRATVLRQRAQQDYDAIVDTPDAESSDESLNLEAAKLEYQIAQAEYDRTMRGASELSLERLRASLDEARRAVEHGQERIEQLRLYAPLDGTVMQVNLQVGEYAYAYSPLVQMADLASLEIRADISELDIASLAVKAAGATGQRAQLWLEAFPGVVLSGEVLRVLPNPSTARGMTTYSAIIAFDAGELPVRPGMGANITIIVEAVEEALLIPRRAVRTVGLNQVVRLVAEGRARDVIVTTGLSNADEIQVLAGLSEGQEVLAE